MEPSRASWVAGVVGALVYAVTLAGDFVIDDHHAIEASPCVTQSLDLSMVMGRNFWCEAPGAQTIDSWRPLPVLAWWAAWQVSAGTPWSFHLLNVVLHALACGLLVQLGRRWFPRDDGFGDVGLAAGLAFATMPIHAEAVASIVGVAELWAACLGIAALLCATRANAEPSRRLRWWSIAMLAIVGALLSKESSVVYPVLVTVIVWLGPHEPRHRIGWTAAAMLVVSGYLLVRADVLGSWFGTHVTATVNPLVNEPPWMRLAVAPALLGRYVVLSVLGYPMSADYGVDQLPVEPLSGYAALGLVVIVATIAVAWRGRRHRGVVYGATWFAGAAALAVNVVALLPAIFAERLFYGVSAPLCLAVGVGLARLVTVRGRRGLVLAGAMLTAWSAAAVIHAWRWTSEDRITAITVEHSPRSARAHVWRARVLGRQRDFEAMRIHASTAVEIVPSWANARALLAASLDATGDPEEALKLFRSAAQQAPGDPEVADLFIQFLLHYGHTDAARLVHARHTAANAGTPIPWVTRP